MENKHTKGPWVLSEYWIWRPHGIQTLQIHSPQIAYINYDNNSEEQQANAKIMAAAPEMLEALMNLENDDNSIPQHAWKLVEDAIKKATE